MEGVVHWSGWWVLFLGVAGAKDVGPATAAEFGHFRQGNGNKAQAEAIHLCICAVCVYVYSNLVLCKFETEICTTSTPNF